MDAESWSTEEMMRLAASGVAKVDRLGPRGTTLCSMDEIAAMAAVVALSGLLPAPEQTQEPGEAPIFRTRRTAHGT